MTVCCLRGSAAICAVLLLSSMDMLGQSLEDRASDLLKTLTATQKQAAVYSFESQERFNWHYVPRSRNGIALLELNDNQQSQVMNLLKASLSEQGNTKANNVLELEDILRSVEGRPAGDDYRDRLNYAFTLFGEPEKGAPWGWRLEGHHLSLNFSSVNGFIESSTPSFLGANPATVPAGKERGRQILKQESDLGFALLNALSDEQKKTAIFATSPPFDILTRNDRRATLPSEKGVSFGTLTPDQQKLFLNVLDVYVRNYEFGFSNKLMAKIKKAGLENLSFAWAGSVNPGAPHYYRLQGPMLLIEFDNTQNNGNHIHSVVRDLTNDFAEDILREHLQKDH